jgi:hypothetical protein
VKPPELEAQRRVRDVIVKFHAALNRIAEEQPFAVRFTVVAAVRLEGGQDMCVETAGSGTSHLTGLMLERASLQHAILRKEISA